MRAFMSSAEDRKLTRIFVADAPEALGDYAEGEARAILAETEPRGLTYCGRLTYRPSVESAILADALTTFLSMEIS